MAASAAGSCKAVRSRLGGLALAVGLAGALASLASPAGAQPPPVTPDDFVAAADGAAQYEVTAARVALVESRDPRVRAFAQEMIRDHTAAMAALREAATRSGLKAPSGGVGADQAPLLAALQGLRGAEFDRAYARQQVLGHSSALATEGGYARSGADANLRAVAAADLPMIQHHLQEAQTLKAAVAG